MTISMIFSFTMNMASAKEERVDLLKFYIILSDDEKLNHVVRLEDGVLRHVKITDKVNFCFCLSYCLVYLVVGQNNIRGCVCALVRSSVQ